MQVFPKPKLDQPALRLLIDQSKLNLAREARCALAHIWDNIFRGRHRHFAGVVLDLQRIDGSQVLRDAEGKIGGFYDPSTDHTRGPDKRILAKGNKLRQLIC